MDNCATLTSYLLQHIGTAGKDWKMKTPESSSRDYLVLWKWSEAEDVKGHVVTGGRGKHSGGLKRGDRMFIWATKGEELYLLGAIQVNRGGRNWAEGKSLYGKFKSIPLKGLKWQLRFQSTASDRLARAPIARQVRSRRQPTPQTIKILERLLSENLGRRTEQARQHANERQAVIRSKAKSRQRDEKIAATKRDALIQARIGQGRFRKDVIALWGECALTGYKRSCVLVASHIVPWKICTNQECLDPFNGLLLTPNLDKLFDQYLISFKNDGAILISKKLRRVEREALGVSDGSKLLFVKPKMLPYLKRHRQQFLKKQK